MAYIFQTLNRTTGKPHPKWRFQYTDYLGQRHTGTGLTSKSETEKLANRIEAEHDEIRKGYRPAPSQSERRKADRFRDVADEYLAWGKAQGGPSMNANGSAFWPGGKRSSIWSVSAIWTEP